MIEIGLWTMIRSSSPIQRDRSASKVSGTSNSNVYFSLRLDGLKSYFKLSAQVFLSFPLSFFPYFFPSFYLLECLIPFQ